MDTNFEQVQNWVMEHPFSPEHVDCSTAVMLKILDGKCKMKAEEKVVMAWLYEAVKNFPGQLLGKDFHDLIAHAKHNLDEEMRDYIYEKRVLAETRISRPVMKGFKAMIRQQGLFFTDENNVIE